MNDSEDTMSHDGDVEEADYTRSFGKAEFMSHCFLTPWSFCEDAKE